MNQVTRLSRQETARGCDIIEFAQFACRRRRETMGVDVERAISPTPSWQTSMSPWCSLPEPCSDVLAKPELLRVPSLYTADRPLHLLGVGPTQLSRTTRR